jgi:hypothetical protein
MPDPQETTPLGRIEHKLEKLDELTRNLATRQDLADLRKEVVQQAVLEPQLGMLKAQIQQLEADRRTDKVAYDKRLEEMEKDQISRQERFWTRIGPIVALIALLLSFLEFFSHIQFK